MLLPDHRQMPRPTHSLLPSLPYKGGAFGAGGACGEGDDLIPGGTLKDGLRQLGEVEGQGWCDESFGRGREAC